MNKTKLEPSKQTFTEAKAGKNQLSPYLHPSVTLSLRCTFLYSLPAIYPVFPSSHLPCIPFQPSTLYSVFPSSHLPYIPFQLSTLYPLPAIYPVFPSSYLLCIPFQPSTLYSLPAIYPLCPHIQKNGVRMCVTFWCELAASEKKMEPIIIFAPPSIPNIILNIM